MVQKWHLKLTVFFFSKSYSSFPQLICEWHLNLKKLALLVVHDTKIRQKLEFWKALKSMSSNAPFHSGWHCLHHASMWCKIIWKLILQLCLGFIQYSLKVLQKKKLLEYKKKSSIFKCSLILVRAHSSGDSGKAGRHSELSFHVSFGCMCVHVQRWISHTHSSYTNLHMKTWDSSQFSCLAPVLDTVHLSII